MKLTLIPREERFFDLFVEAAANVLGAARLLDAMLRSYDDVERRIAEIAEAERRGNEIEREVRDRVDATFVPPFDRSDVRALMRAIDAVLDSIEETADTFLRYDIASPTAAAVEGAAIIVRQCEGLHAALGRLPARSSAGSASTGSSPRPWTGQPTRPTSSNGSPSGTPDRPADRLRRPIRLEEPRAPGARQRGEGVAPEGMAEREQMRRPGRGAPRL